MAMAGEPVGSPVSGSLLSYVHLGSWRLCKGVSDRRLDTSFLDTPMPVLLCLRVPTTFNFSKIIIVYTFKAVPGPLKMALALKSRHEPREAEARSQDKHNLLNTPDAPPPRRLLAISSILLDAVALFK